MKNLEYKKLTNKKNTKKGFTLAELLIVVAIIGVLAVIAVPIFTSQLEKSREGTDLANMRSAKSEAIVKYMSDGSTGNFSYEFDAKNGKILVIDGYQNEEQWDADDLDTDDLLDADEDNYGKSTKKGVQTAIENVPFDIFKEGGTEPVTADADIKEAADVAVAGYCSFSGNERNKIIYIMITEDLTDATTDDYELSMSWKDCTEGSPYTVDKDGGEVASVAP